MYTNTNLTFSIILAFAICVGVANTAGAQQPVWDLINANRSTESTKANELSQRQPQLRRSNRRGFSLMPASYARKHIGVAFNFVPTAHASNQAVLGSGTLGRLTKWTGLTSGNSLIGDSTIFEDKNGLIGIGSDKPTSRLTVAGTIEITTGGLKFPDGTIQTTSSTGSLVAVTHDRTLIGSGTPAAPLGVASPLEVRDLDNPARQPLQLSGNCVITGFSCRSPLFVVPDGKRFVIEYVSLHASSPVGQVAALQIITIFRGVETAHSLTQTPPAVEVGVGTEGFSQAGGTVRLYADPGTLVSVIGFRSGNVGIANLQLSLSGYLFDVP